LNVTVTDRANRVRSFVAVPRLDPGTEGPVQASDKEAVKGIYDYCNARLLDSLETDGHRRFWYVRCVHA
jgi:hypothetical protein